MSNYFISINGKNTIIAIFNDMIDATPGSSQSFTSVNFLIFIELSECTDSRHALCYVEVLPAPVGFIKIIASNYYISIFFGSFEFIVN